MTYYISVEPTRFKDDTHAPLIVRKGREGRPEYTRFVYINGPSALVCSLSDPLPDGTRAWIETAGPVEYKRET